MGQSEVVEEETGAAEAMLKPARHQRRSIGWRKMLLCCLQAADDDVRELDYQHASLTDVPVEVFNHERTLEVLRLDCNQITDLPRPLFHCHGLKELMLADNEISQLPPALQSLIHLQVLDVSKNSLAEIPDAISGLKALVTLDLSVNPLGKLPEGATKLLALESLNLSDTFLDFLPANFGRLTKLRLLELRENQLATLPKSMARLTLLKRLDLGQNDLCDVPEVVGSIPSLTELWLDGNKLDVLPDFLGHLPNLVHLDASRNILHGIAPNIALCKSLTDLSLTTNNLASLPEEIGDLSQLTVLRVDDNRLTSLPDSIGRLVALEELQAGQNRLSRLPAAIGLLRKLHTLMLNENQLEELPAELGSCQQLTVLSLRKNRLERLPPEMGQLSRLRVVNVSCNRLLYLPVSFLKLQPSLTALWLSEAQTKPVVPLQTDTDPGTGHKVLTCFLLPQTEGSESEDDQKPDKEKDGNPVAVAARSPTHIKFAFDGETDHRAGRLMRNPTPYPKELKALAKHAQHIQQHQPNSPRNSFPPSNSVAKEPEAHEASPVTPPAPLPTSAVPYVEPSLAVVSKLSSSSLSNETMAPIAAHPGVEPPRASPEPVAAVQQPTSRPMSMHLQPAEPSYPAPLLPAAPEVPKRGASLENLLDSAPQYPNKSPDVSPRPADIEIKEARVMRPVKSADLAATAMTTTTPPPPLEDGCASQIDVTDGGVEPKQVPPPYHVAAAYSKRAAEFGQLPRTQSTDSGFTVDGLTNGKAAELEKRDSSPSRDSGRGPSIEPLEESVQPVVKRPADLPLTGLLDVERQTPLMIKRSTFIIETNSDSPPFSSPPPDEETDDLQSVAALRQAAREVFLSSPRASPLPTHKPSWDTPPQSSLATPLSAANVIGLPSASSGEHQQPPAKVQGRLPTPKYHLNSNGIRETVVTPAAEVKSPPVATTTRIPLPKLSTSALPRQTSSNMLDENVPALPPKQQQQQQQHQEAPPPPTLPKMASFSRIPAPQVHAPAIPSPTVNTSIKASFSPLPVHTARLVTPITPTNNNDDGLLKSQQQPTGGTRIPLPKYSTSDLLAKSGPSPVSRIPTRLPTPTSSNAAKGKLSLDGADRSTASPALSARIQ